MNSNYVIEVIVNDRLGKKIRVKCLPNDSVSILKQLISAHIGTKPDKIKLIYGNNTLNDNILLEDYEIKNGSGIELYYN